MAKNKGMVQLGGTTYRIVLRGGGHEVIRLRDDSKIGCFLHEPVLKVVESTFAPELVLGVAVCALRSAVVQRKSCAPVERWRLPRFERAAFPTWRALTALVCQVLAAARLVLGWSHGT